MILMSQNPNSEKGIVHILSLILLILGIAFGIYLISQRTNWLPKAALSGPILSGPVGSTPFGQAVQFTNNAFITINPPSYPSGSFTAEGWINIPKPASGNYIRDYSILTMTTQQSPYDYGYNLRFSVETQESTGVSRPFFSAKMLNANSYNIGQNYISVGGNGTLTILPNVWTHIAVTSYTENNLCKLKLFINGVQSDYREAYSSNCQISTINQRNIVFAKPADGMGGISGYYFPGQIDEFRLSTGILYTSNFIPPVSPFTPTSSTKALYHFNGNTNDSGGGVFNGTVNGQIQYVTSTIVTPSPTPIVTPSPSLRPTPSPISSSYPTPSPISSASPSAKPSLPPIGGISPQPSAPTQSSTPSASPVPLVFQKASFDQTPIQSKPTPIRLKFLNAESTSVPVRVQLVDQFSQVTTKSIIFKKIATAPIVTPSPTPPPIQANQLKATCQSDGSISASWIRTEDKRYKVVLYDCTGSNPLSECATSAIVGSTESTVQDTSQTPTFVAEALPGGRTQKVTSGGNYPGLYGKVYNSFQATKNRFYTLQLFSTNLDGSGYGPVDGADTPIFSCSNGLTDFPTRRSPVNPNPNPFSMEVACQADGDNSGAIWWAFKSDLPRPDDANLYRVVAYDCTNDATANCGDDTKNFIAASTSFSTVDQILKSQPLIGKSGQIFITRPGHKYDVQLFAKNKSTNNVVANPENASVSITCR